MEWLKRNFANFFAHVSAKWVHYIAGTAIVALLSVFGIVITPPDKPDEPIFPDGWKANQAEVLKVREGLDFKRFSETPAYKAVQENGDPEEVFLWKAYLKVDGKLPNAKNQGQVGSCVGFGTTSAIETSFIVSLSADPNLAANPPPHRFSEEVTYGISRVDIGGGQIGGDGSIGAWAVEGAKKIGMAERRKYNTYDLTVYNERTCREFGRRGIPEDVKAEAKLHPIKDFTQVVTVAECYKSLANGYGVVVCSNRGFGSKRDKDGFLMPSGSWAHCVPYGTMISTRTPKPCQDVVVGDEVVSHDGNLHKVNEVHVRDYDGPMYSFTTKGMVDTKFTEHHPVLVYRRMDGHGIKHSAGLALEVYAGGRYAALKDRYAEHEAGQPMWLAAEEVEIGDYLLSPKLKFGEKLEFPEWESTSKAAKNMPKWPENPSKNIPWLFGMYVADGNAVEDHKVIITLGKKEDASAERACAAWRELGLEPYVYEEDTFKRVTVYSSVAAKSFRKWFGTSSQTKHFPDFVYSGWDKESLIEGYVDGDGCERSSGGLVITTVSNSLALQVHQLLLSVGENPYMGDVCPNGGFPNRSQGWYVQWKPESKKLTAKSWGDYYLMPINKISVDNYKGKVWNYEIEGTHTYLANNLVSHNCMSILGYKKGTRPGFFIWNSWGDNWVSGPKGAGDPPEGGFWADESVVARMLSQGDSWSVTDVKGFEPRPVDKLDWFVKVASERKFAKIKKELPFGLAW